jgi:hypothetical protein
VIGDASKNLPHPQSLLDSLLPSWIPSAIFSFQDVIINTLFTHFKGWLKLNFVGVPSIESKKTTYPFLENICLGLKIN